MPGRYVRGQPSPGPASPDHQHVYDTVADDLASYIERMSDDLAQALQENGRAPFAARLSRAEQEQYYLDRYGDMIFHPDGTPNQDGREAFLKAFGPDAFAEMVRIKLRAMRRQAAVGEPLDYPLYADQAAPPGQTDLPAPPPIQQGAPGAPGQGVPVPYPNPPPPG